MATRQWAVTGDGVYSFNNPANWAFGVVPGVLDIADFNTAAAVTDTVTGNAEIAAIEVDQGDITLTGSYTISGTQATELSVTGGFGFATIRAGAFVNGNKAVSVAFGALEIAGSLAASGLTINGGAVYIDAGATFGVGGTIVLSNLGSLIAKPAPNQNAGAAVVVNNAISISDTVDLGSFGGQEFDLDGAISGTGTVDIIGAPALNGNNTYSGGTVLGLLTGTLAVGNANGLGTGTLTIGAGELLGTATETIGNRLSMSGNFTIAAAHGTTLTLHSANGWSMSQSAGEVIDFGAAGQDGTIVFYVPSGSAVSNFGTAAVVIQAGTLKAGDNELNFLLDGGVIGTTVEAGATLDANGFGLTVTDLQGSGTVTDSGAAAKLTLPGGDFSGTITGAFSVSVGGALTLSGDSTYTGTTTIGAAAVLTLGDNGTTGSVPGSITDNGVLDIDRGDNFTLNNISGSGSVVQSGSGTTILGTGLGYSGGTTITDGTLSVGDPTALGSGDLTISGGELLATATETIANHLGMNGSFTIAAAHGQTLTVSSTNGWSLPESPGQIIDFGAAGQDGTIVFYTPDGSSVSNAGETAFALQDGTLKAGDSALGFMLGSGITTTVQSGATLDMAGHAVQVTGLQGSGVVTDSGSAAALGVSGGDFAGTLTGALSLTVAGSVTLSDDNTYSGGTTILGGATLTLGNDGTTGSVPGSITDNGTLDIDRSDTFALNNVSGTGNVVQSGSGTTLLGSGLTYSGGTSVTGGTLSVGNPTALGSGGLTLGGGELLATATETISNQLTMSGNFTIAAAHGQTLTLSSANAWTLTGSTGEVIDFGAAGQDGVVVFDDTSGFTIVNPGTYTVAIQAGSLKAGDAGLALLLDNDIATNVAAGATLDAAGFTLAAPGLQGNGLVTDSGAGATFAVTGGNFAGQIAAGLALRVDGALSLTGNNSYTGGTTINGDGELTLGNGGATGSIAGDIADNGMLTFFLGSTAVENGAISGTGEVVQAGTGTTVLTAANSYSGGTLLAGGTLELQQSGSAGSNTISFLPGTIATLKIDGTAMPSNAIANFAPGDAIDLANIVANGSNYSGGVLTLTENGTSVAQLNLSASLSHPHFGVSADGAGGTRIVVEPPPPQDFNADNLADLVFQAPTNLFLGSLSNGSGFAALQPWVQHGGSFIPGRAQYADLNGDGKADLIMQGTDNTFYVSLSTSANFTAPAVWAKETGSFTAGQAQYADVNGDGKADLIFQGLDNGFLVSLSSGSGFGTPQKWVQHGGSFVAGRAQYADLNGDGKADLIMQGSDNTFYVSLSTGTSFTAPATWAKEAGSFTAGAAQYADVNGDGKADLIFQQPDNSFWVSLSSGSGFSAPQKWVQHGGSFIAGHAQYADVNGDGKADLIMQGTDNQFWVSLSTGTGFTAPQSWVQEAGSFAAGQAQYADVNGDGKADLLFQATDNKEYLSLSSGSGFQAPQQVADFSAYGNFQAGQLHV